MERLPTNILIVFDLSIDTAKIFECFIYKEGLMGISDSSYSYSLVKGIV